jgi:hypothetical protein
MPTTLSNYLSHMSFFKVNLFMTPKIYCGFLAKLGNLGHVGDIIFPIKQKLKIERRNYC